MERNLIDILTDQAVNWMAPVDPAVREAIQANAINTLMNNVDHPDNRLTLRQAAVTLLTIDNTEMDRLEATLKSLKDAVEV